MIDLHTHTNYSDGTWSVVEMLQHAENSNIEVLSITDHDTIKAHKELATMNIKKYYSGQIIPGAEFTVVHNGILFHMLAYNFDYKKLDSWVHNNCELKQPNLQTEFQHMYTSCKKNNVIIGNLEYNESQGWPVDIIYKEIKKYPENKKLFTQEEWDNVNIFFGHCVSHKDFPAYVDFSINYPQAITVSKKVKEAGGKLFIAHSYRYHLKNTISFIDELRNSNIIDGVEVYHSSFSKYESNSLIEYCKKNNLLMSGGTDCHGEKHPEIKIGIGYGNMKVEKEIINNWLN